MPQLDVGDQGRVSIRGFFLDYVRNFTVFETNDEKIIKKIAAYHQFHAVPQSDRCNGLWHRGLRAIIEQASFGTHQGSGKSLTMLFYAGRLIEQSELKNPTVCGVDRSKRS